MAVKRTANNINNPGAIGMDPHTYAQKQKEAKKPGGVWVDGWYIEPGLDFSGFAQPAAQPTAQPAAIDTAAQTSLAPVAPVKTPDELRAEAAGRATNEVATNADFLQGNAGLFNALSQKLAGYDQQAGYARSDFTRNDLTRERNRGLANESNNANLADRGIQLGGVAQQSQTRLNENYDMDKVNATDSLNRSLSAIEQSKGGAQTDFQNQQLALRQSIIDKLIERYSAQSLAPVKG